MIFSNRDYDELYVFLVKVYKRRSAVDSEKKINLSISVDMRGFSVVPPGLEPGTT
jgi:hypothetical protein